MALHVADVLHEVEHERQRAHLYAHARQQLARRYLGGAPPGDEGVDVGVLAEVLEHLLVMANDATQRAQRMLRRRVSTGER